MDSTRSGVDLERELTCSICTEVLFQPLTLLDCLHTFCGSCLRDWFSWQKTAAENSPNPPSPGTQIFTCPSCRAPVRDTRHNATVTTLLEMFLAANPEKAKPEEEKEEMRIKYKPGDNVLPQVRLLDKSAEERRLEEMERQMLERAREMSLRDAGFDSSDGGSRSVRHRDYSRSEDGRSRSDRESSRDPRYRNARDRTRREDERRRRAESNGMLQAESSSDERRRHRSESQQHSRESSRTRRRHIEHQASIRSLISSSDVDSLDLEREIDDFARQIQEEGLLDGLDLDNIDLNRNDELSRRITDAYRRRQRERSHPQPAARRSNTSLASHRSEAAQSHPRLPVPDTLRPTSRQRSNSAHTRPPSSAGSGSQTEDRSRPPISSTHLEVRPGPERRRRRRTSSGGRSATDPVRPSTADARPATRSQTDLTLRSHSFDPAGRRPSLVEGRSTSMPIGNAGENPDGKDLSFSGRASAAQNANSMVPPPLDPHSDDSSNERKRRAPRPTSLVAPQKPLPSLGLISSPTRPSHHQRQRSQYYQEPSITCSRCHRAHIEYELHYNCGRCSGGNWNLCLSCYRTGKGCLHWFGFGYSAWNKWERAQAAGNEHMEAPHMLTSNRYVPPKVAPGGAEGRKTLTTDDPATRLESGMFCCRCFSWANECFWRCDYCNEGDWGFCNTCVNQGHGCTHPLLPLTYVPPMAPGSLHTPPGSPPSPRCPPSATLFTGPNAISIGNFKPLTFTTTCDVCRTAIPPVHRRYHCFECVSTVVPDTQPGDYDICVGCYDGLIDTKRISEENGFAGWRRCLNGHRMSIIGFTEARGGQRRYTVQDIVGGRDLHMEAYDNTNTNTAANEQGSGLQKWWWYGPDRSKLEKLATMDVAAVAPAFGTEAFPPDGGVGMKGTATWSWYPQAGSEDELLFPKGAEVREVEDVNGDWFFGSYMGGKGLFPAPYVRVYEQ